MRIIKKIFIALVVFVIAFTGYVLIVNRNSKDMNTRQKVLKAIYPIFMAWKRLTGSADVIVKKETVAPPKSIYDLQVELNNGKFLPLSEYRGKKILLVNTASECGYTNQYQGLQELFSENKDKMVVIGFPANDFKEQEKGSDAEIEQFCKVNYGVEFPLAKKSSVIRSPQQNTIFKWLTDSTNNGWNNKQPSWNFSKYLINENGVLTHYFEPAVAPTSNEVINAINEK